MVRYRHTETGRRAMNTFILNTETATWSIDSLLKQVNQGGVEVRDTQGNLLAFVLSPTDRDAWTYAEANLDINQNLDQVRRALGRSGGSTTVELLTTAESAANTTAR